MQTVFPPEQDSIFGMTYQGVPNPNVPHVHPYPTRYHGANYTVPGTANISYRQTPYTKAPYMGVGAVDLNISRSSLVDAAIGGTIGYVASPKKDNADRAAYAAMGAISTYVAGTVGLIGFGVFLAWKHGKIG